MKNLFGIVNLLMILAAQVGQCGTQLLPFISLENLDDESSLYQLTPDEEAKIENIWIKGEPNIRKMILAAYGGKVSDEQMDYQLEKAKKSQRELMIENVIKPRRNAQKRIHEVPLILEDVGAFQQLYFRN